MLLRARFSEVAEHVQRMAFLPRETAGQLMALAQAEEVRPILAAHKHDCVSAGDHDEADEVLLMELSLAAVVSQLRMCITLKADKGEEAWEYLVDAQTACANAIRVRGQVANGPDAEALESLCYALSVVETVVFPPQVFLSIGGVARSRECSICGTDYAGCPHVHGMAYAGELCNTIIRGMILDEVSIVEVPASKRCRITHFSDAGGRRNRMTWSIEASHQGVAPNDRGAELSLEL